LLPASLFVASAALTNEASGSHRTWKEIREVMRNPKRITSLIAAVVTVLACGMGYFDIHTTSRAVGNAIDSIPDSSQSGSASYSQGGLLGFLESSTRRLTSVADLAEDLPRSHQVLRTGKNKIDNRWFSWLHPSRTCKQDLVSNIKAIENILAQFSRAQTVSSDCYTEGLRLYRAGPGRTVGKAPYVRGKEELYGHRNVTALEEALSQYRRDVISYTFVKVCVLSIASTLIGLAVARLTRMRQQPPRRDSDRPADGPPGTRQE